MVNRIISRIKVFISRRVGPVMIYGFRSSDGSWRKKSRYGSTTTFQYKERIDMGEGVFIAHFCMLDGSNGLKLGEGCQITSWVTITTHSSHISVRLYGKNYGGTQMIGYQNGRVEIGAYCFVGPHVVIMPGSTIGKGCVVAAFSFVKGDFPDFSVIAGNPAKVVGDTRKMDAPYLEAHPELRPSYENWAGVQEFKTGSDQNQTPTNSPN